MKCKKHFTDLSSTIGVCATCLRERLFVLIAAQVQAQSQSVQDRRNSDSNPNPNPPPPLVFPRSVSPYICRRKSDTTAATIDAWNDTQLQPKNCLPDQRFYSTPQVGPTGSVVISGPYHKKKNGRFSLFANLFRSKSDKLEESSDISGFTTESFTTTSSSSSWFSTMLPGRRKKQSRTFSVVDESTTGVGPGHRRRVNRKILNRGMSPARYSDDEEEDEHCFPNELSGYSSESPSQQPWKQTPRQTPAWMPPGKRGGGRNITGMGFCLSPLVRASPSSKWNKKGIPPEMVVSGEIRAVPVRSHHHLSSATSFCNNRSRKLADFGRFHHNR